MAFRSRQYLPGDTASGSVGAAPARRGRRRDREELARVAQNAPACCPQTYPLEVVEAARWVSAPANRTLTGAALTNALQAQNWDPSIKALVPFPRVLANMSDQLQWTQNLGNAFLAQQADVMAAV